MGFAPRAAFVADIGVNVGKVPMSWAGPSAGPGLDILVATRFAAPQKRQDLLIEAAALIRDRLPVKMAMVGTGGTREAAIARRDALGLHRHLEIRPFLAQEELWARMRTADLLCHPCEHEGVSKIILEAMMLGLPVLASDVPPLPDYVIEGETGYRVANTPEAWAARLARDRRRQGPAAGALGRARAFVEATYDTAVNVARYEAAFTALVPPGRGDGAARACSIVAVVLAAVAALVEHHAEHLGLLGELLLALVDLVEPAALGGGDRAARSRGAAGRPSRRRSAASAAGRRGSRRAGTPP